MYKIIDKNSKQILVTNLTLKQAKKEIIYITTKCDLYKKNELEIVKE